MSLSCTLANNANMLGKSTIRLIVLCLNAKRHGVLQSDTYDDVSSCSISRRLPPLMEWLQGENSDAKCLCSNAPNRPLKMML